MSFQEAALAQVVLEGVPLPSDRARLLEYALEQEGGEYVTQALLRLPDRGYGTLDEVGEALAPVQPAREHAQPREPRAESGVPPGGQAYTDVSQEPGWVREHGPRD